MKNLIERIKEESEYSLSNSPCNFEFGIIGETIAASYIDSNGELQMDFILIQRNFDELLEFVEKWYKYACDEDKYILELNY